MYVQQARQTKNIYQDPRLYLWIHGRLKLDFESENKYQLCESGFPFNKVTCKWICIIFYRIIYSVKALKFFESKRIGYKIADNGKYYEFHILSHDI